MRYNSILFDWLPDAIIIHNKRHFHTKKDIVAKKRDFFQFITNVKWWKYEGEDSVSLRPV